ncbi:hypothetical protein JXQ31_02765 [candidate division KSB1 bacterium]|nr:hypothetical protein [candidate division KSB1 bacterium]
MKKILFALLLLPLSLFSQGNSLVSVWEPFDYFVGNWDGHETGRAGIGKGDRSYQFIMDGHFLFMKNISRFEPQEKNPDGETHEDWTIFSFDEARQKFIIRQFNIEGFINRFVLDSLVNRNNTFIFTSESSENAPPGLRARLSYYIQDQDEFRETFELAMPGKDFVLFLENFWKRRK